MQKQKEFLKMDFNNRTAKALILTYEFIDNDFYVAYYPSFNISGYGKNQEEAVEMLDVAFDEFLKELCDLGEVKGTEELKKLGWMRSPYFKKQFTSTTYVDREGVLKNFNLSEETEIKEHFVAV